MSHPHASVRIGSGARSRTGLAGLFAALAICTPLLAAEPQVFFDVSYAVPCRDVTTPEFAALNPDEMVIEATYRVSVLLLAGEEDDLDELMLVITSPGRRLRVVDFAPNTEVASDIAGTVEVVETVEDTESADLTIGGGAKFKEGPIEAHITPSAGTGHSHRTSANEKYQRLPPKRLVLASGTLAREHGVFFKLKPTTQDSLQGLQTFVVRYVVPRDWSGDWAVVDCRARATLKSYFRKSVSDVGKQHVYVGLYLEGDENAKSTAAALAAAQQQRSADRGSSSGPLSAIVSTTLDATKIVPGISHLTSECDDDAASRHPEVLSAAWSEPSSSGLDEPLAALESLAGDRAARE